MARAAVYARYSSDRQNERSITDQLAFCRQLCARAGYSVVAEFSDEAVSGASTLNRPGWRRLMALAGSGAVDVVVLETTSRAFRDEADYHAARKQLDFHEIKIHAAKGVVSRIEGTITALQDAMYLEQLAIHVHRGQAGRVRAGSHVSSPSYGYRAVPGAPGQLAVVEAQAEIVRRILTEFADGRSPRTIAAGLNADRIPSPRGGSWNASTINGSRVRANGILQNRLYVGEIVWNRQRFKKNPGTGTRVSRANDQAEWITAPAPALRLVDDDLWQRVQARLAQRGEPAERRRHAQPRHLLSGLVKCGHCGSSYVVTDTRLVCSRWKESRSCSNATRIRRQNLEQLIVQAVQQQLAAPELVQRYVREYHRLADQLGSEAARRRTQLQRRLASVTADAQLLVTALLELQSTRTVRERLAQLEAERGELEAQLAALELPPIRLHPNAGATYRRKVEQLGATLEALGAQDAALGSDHQAQAFALIRELVERITVRPNAAGELELEVEGRAAALLQAAEGQRVSAAGERYSHPLALQRVVGGDAGPVSWPVWRVRLTVPAGRW